MASNTIEDGTGDGFKMKVDKDKRAHSQSLSIPYEDFAVLSGDSFGVLSSIVDLTSSATSYLLYVLNSNSHDMVVSNLSAAIGLSVGGTTTDWNISIQINPTGGTLITAGVPTVGVNNNLGSAETLDVVALTGVEGSTATGGIPVTQLTKGEDSYSLNQKVVIPPGSSLAIGLTPPSGNTSTKVSIGLTLIKQTLDIS